MTVGNVSQGTFASGPYGFQKSWSGQNGPKETVNAAKRNKWNNYTMNLVEQRKKQSNAGNWPSISVSASDYKWTANHDVALQGKLVTAVRGHDFNLAVNVAQGVQATNMVVGNLTKLGRSFLALKRGDPGNAFRQLGTGRQTRPLRAQDVPGRWLEMQYGWMPLIKDSYEAWKAYHVLTQDSRKSTVKVRKRSVNEFDGTASPVNYKAPGLATYRKQIIYEMNEDLSAPRSLGLLDPLSVAWEIIPYSFVVDWFLPIGAYLDNLSVIPKLEGRFLTTVFKKGRCTINWSRPASSYTGVTGYQHEVRLTRTVSTGLSTAFPRFVPIPQAMSSLRIYNAIALTSQIFLR